VRVVQLEARLAKTMYLAGSTATIWIGSNQVEACSHHHCIQCGPIEKSNVEDPANLSAQVEPLLVGHLSENVTSVP